MAPSRSGNAPASRGRACGGGGSGSPARACLPGLLRDRTRKPGLPPLPAATIDRVVELTHKEPPGEATHWTGRMMAEAVGISLRSVQRIWAAHRVAPHRVRTFKLSRDAAFVPKLRDVVGGLSGIPCAGHDEGTEGTLAWHAAKPRSSPTSCWTSCWPAVIRSPLSAGTACSTS